MRVKDSFRWQHIALTHFSVATFTLGLKLNLERLLRFVPLRFQNQRSESLTAPLNLYSPPTPMHDPLPQYP